MPGPKETRKPEAAGGGVRPAKRILHHPWPRPDLRRPGREPPRSAAVDPSPPGTGGEDPESDARRPKGRVPAILEQVDADAKETAQEESRRSETNRATTEVRGFRTPNMLWVVLYDPRHVAHEPIRYYYRAPIRSALTYIPPLPGNS